MKRKLFLLGGVLLASFLGAKAQTSPYTGSEVAEGDFFIYNVETGLWLQNNEKNTGDYNTRGATGTYGFDFAISAVDDGNGYYGWKLNPKFGHNGSMNASNFYLDTGEALTIWTLEPKTVEGVSNAYTIRAGENVLGLDDNDNMAFNTNQKDTWQLVTRAERIAYLEANASETNPLDATFLIQDPGFANENERRSAWTTWTRSGGNQDETRWYWNRRSYAFWNSSSFEVSQTINNVPNGTYKLQVKGYYRDGNRDEVASRRAAGTERLLAKYFINNDEEPMMSILDGANPTWVDGIFYYPAADAEAPYGHYPDNADAFNRAFQDYPNNYMNTGVTSTVTTKTIYMGLKKTEANANDWAAFDEFRLTYLGNNIDLSDYVNALSKCIEEAEGLDTSNTSTKLAYALAAAIGEAKDLLNSTDTNAMSLATQVLSELIERVKAVNVDMLRQTVAVAEEGVDVSAANDVIANALTAQEVTDALFDLRTARKLNAMCTPDIFTGSAPQDGVEYFIYNMGTGMWLNHGSDYDTHTAIDAYALPITLVGDGENFKLKNHAFYRDEQWINFNAYVDTGNADRWFFQPVEGKENVYNIVVFDRHDLALGYNPYGHTDRWGFDRHYPFNVAKEQTDMANPNNQWKLVSRAELDSLYANATEENPVDVSYLIKNPELTRVWNMAGNDLRADGNHPVDWNLTCESGNKGKIVTIGDDDDMVHNSNYGYEVWNADSFSFTQTIEGLKPGLYEVSVSGFFRQGDGGFQAGVVNEGGELISEAYLEANGEQAYLPNVASEAGKLPGIFSQNSANGTFANWPGEALNAFETGLYNGTKVQCVVGFDGKLTIGVKQDEKTTDNSWVLFDSFHLCYLGPTPIKSMTVVGDFTGGWEIADGLDMTQDSENPAIWTAIVDEFVVELEEGQTERKYEYKATANGVWGQYELPAEGNNNWVFGSADYPAGTYSLLFTADTENHVLTVEPTLKTSTGISELNSSDATKVVYNLNGQRMQQTQRGLYIVNGKKQIVK